MIGGLVTLAAICIAAIIAMHHVRHARREDPTPHGSFSYQDGSLPPGTMTSRELADTEDD